MPWLTGLARLVVAVVVTVTTVAAAAGLGGLSAGAFRGAAASRPLPAVELEPLPVRGEIVAADGSVIASLYAEDRVPVALHEVPQVLVDAVVVTEDAAFFQHDGISLRGVLRAARSNAEAGDVREGGSTITQQLVKNALLEAERTYDRKAREAVLAYRVERQLTKEQILERYLNTVYFGSGAHGVQAAAERFAGKHVSQLTLGEAALLAGLISSPDDHDPFRNPEAATARRDHVLRRMVEHGAASPADADAARREPLPTAVRTRPAQPDNYFAEEVRRQLLAEERLGATRADRENLLLRGGVRVETTLDPNLQRVAEQAVAGNLPPSKFTAALVAVDPRTGDVRAMVGGPNFEQAEFNLATQGKRQTGSAFKTVALAAWIADGRSPEDVVDATAPCSFPRPAPELVWNVDNYDGGSGETLVTTLREATVRSANCAFARLALQLGPAKLEAMARRLGVTRDLPPEPSIVLGTGEVTPLEMASVYATLAADGVRRAPTFVRRVVDRSGRVLLENTSPGEQVVDPEVARTVTEVLRGVVESGTGTRARIGRPAAGKTGTTQLWRDAWFAGYTPQLAAAVWMGSPAGQESMIGVGGVNVTGGSFPAQIWGAFMSTAVGATAAEDFPPPDPARWPPPMPVGGALAALATTTTAAPATTTTAKPVDREREDGGGRKGKDRRAGP